MPTKHERVCIMLSKTFNAADATVAMMKEQPNFKPVLEANPNFINEIRNDFLERLAPVFEGMSDEAISAVTAFYETPAAAEFRDAQGLGAIQVAAIMQRWVKNLQERILQLMSSGAQPALGNDPQG